MLRLSLVFLVWIASTATFVERSEVERVDEYERSYYYARR